MFNVTKGADLSNELLAAENYVIMVESRDGLMVQLEEIDKELAEHFTRDDSSTEETEIRNRIAGLVKEIVAEDKKRKDEANDFISSIKDNIVQIKKSKDVKKHYEYDLYLTDSEGKGFDRSN